MKTTIYRAEENLRDFQGFKLRYLPLKRAEELFERTIMYIIPGDKSFHNNEEFEAIMAVRHPQMDDNLPFNEFCEENGLEWNNVRFYTFDEREEMFKIWWDDNDEEEELEFYELLDKRYLGDAEFLEMLKVTDSGEVYHNDNINIQAI